MRVPAAALRERHLDADAGLDQHRDLAQAPAQRAAGIVDSRRRPVGRGVQPPQHLGGLEGLAGGVEQQALRGLLVERLESATGGGERRRPGQAETKVGQVGDRQGRRRPVERARHRAGHGHGAKRRRLVTEQAAHPVEPAGIRTLAARRPALHVVLGVEVGAGGIGRADRVHDRQPPLPPQRQQGVESRVQAESHPEVEQRRGAGAARGAYRQARPQPYKARIAEWRHRRQTVHRPALEKGDDDLAAASRRRRGQRGAAQEQQPRAADPDGEESHASGLEERASTAWAHVGSPANGVETRASRG